MNNDTADDKEIAIPASREAADWVIIANGESAGLVSLGEVSGSTVKVPAYTTMILVDKESSLQVSVPEEKGRVIIDYLRTDGYGNSSFDICVCGAYSVDGATGRRMVDETFLKKRFLPREKEFSAKSHPDYIFNFASNVPWQRLYRADFIRKCGVEFQPLRHANDTYFVLVATYCAEKIVCCPKPLINYRTNNSQSVTGKASKDPLCAYEAYKAAYNRLLELGLGGKALQSFHSKLLSGLIRAVMLQTSGEAMQLVYDKIKNEGLEYFGIADKNNSDYFYFKPDFEDLEAIKAGSLPEFLMFKYRKEKEGRLYYKSRAERSLKIRLARKIAGLLPANSSLYDKGKKLLRFK